MIDRIKKIFERWFLYDPLLFQVVSMYKLVENDKIKCPMRSGKEVIEYNPELIRGMSDICLEETIRTEALRILLKHPFERKPDLCSLQAVAIGSNITVSDNYTFSAYDIDKAKDFDLEPEMSYEWYSHKIQEMMDACKSSGEEDDEKGSGSDAQGLGGGAGAQGDDADKDDNKRNDGDAQGQGSGEGNGDGDGDGDSDGNGDSQGQGGGSSSAGSGGSKSQKISFAHSKPKDKKIRNFDHTKDSDTDLAELWEEDELQVAKINQMISTCTNWGSLSGGLAELLQASTKAKIDWKNVFAGFRASILSSKRRLTRMRPNRRSGFAAMGSTKQFITKVLVAVDVSGSVCDKSLSYFYGVINNAFKYGIESIDVVQFDCGLTKVESLKKATKKVQVVGRGGTSFQEPVDYANENGYDGLVILTDGYAPEPEIPDNSTCRIMWVFDCPSSYDDNHVRLGKCGRTCMIDLR